MPRFTEEQRKKLIAELMKENDDDDDDDLLKPSLIHPSNRSTSSPHNKENNEKKEEETVPLFTEQELKEQGSCSSSNFFPFTLHLTVLTRSRYHLLCYYSLEKCSNLNRTSSFPQMLSHHCRSRRFEVVSIRTKGVARIYQQGSFQ